MRLLHTFLLAAIAGGGLMTAWAEDPPAKPPQKPAQTSPPPALNLAPPDVRKIVPPQDLEGPLADVDAPEEEPTEVQVHGDHSAPQIPGNQIAALWWGFTHPSQAWRIFTPVQ
jgi:hypothetical protein